MTRPHHTIINCGCEKPERCDFPTFAQAVCQNVLLDPKNNRGILICGSGVGMSIAANRFKGIYAALCWSKTIARHARDSDNANVLVLASLETDATLAVQLVSIFLSTEFKGGDYATRLAMIDT